MMTTVLHVHAGQTAPRSFFQGTASEFPSREVATGTGAGAIGALAAAVRASGATLLHAHDGGSLAAAFAASRLRLPVVATFNAELAGSGLRLLGNLCSSVAVTSVALREPLKRWLPFTPIHHIPDGIEAAEPIALQERLSARAALGIPVGMPALAVMGRFSADDGCARFIEAARALPHPPILIFAGERPPPPTLYAACAGLRTQQRDPHSQARQLLAAADLVILPSLLPGSSAAALGAMAHGRPVLASPMGDLPELLGEGAGQLLRYRSVADWAHTLRRLLRDPGELQSLGDRGRARARERYGLEQMAQKQAELLYRPALRRKG